MKKCSKQTKIEKKIDLSVHRDMKQTHIKTKII